MPTVGIPLLISDDVPKILAIPAVNSTDSVAAVASDATPNIVILTLVSATDGLVVVAGDVAQAPTVLIPTAEPLTVGLTDTITILFKSTEGIPLHTVDLASVFVTQPATDTTAIQVLDLPAVAVAQAVTDAGVVGLTDASPSVPLIVPTTDSLTVQASDAPPTVNTGGASINPIAATDSLTCGLTDVPPPESSSVSASDTISVTIDFGAFGEETSIFGFTPQQFVQVSVVDTCVVRVITNQFNFYASDSCAVQAIEPTDNSHTFQGADALAVQAADAAPAVNTGIPPQASFSVTDTLLVQAGDIPTVVKTTFDVFLSTTDVCVVQTTEAIALASDIIFLGTSDSAAIIGTDVGYFPTRLLATTDSAVIQAVEPTDAMSFPSVFDAPAVQASDAFPQIAGSFSFNVNDSLTVQASDARPTFPLVQAVVASESIVLAPVDGGPLVASAVFASDALGIGLNDAALLVLKFLALTDPLGVPITDAASIFNSFIAVAASDANVVQASDVVTFVQQSLTQLSTTEALGLGLDDSLARIDAQTFSSDSIVAVAQEFSAVLNAFFPQDSVAYQIDAENANIINPFVINSALSVADTMTSDVAENTLGLPSRLSFFVTEALTMGLTDVALSEGFDPPGTLDFRIDVSYKDINDPQSFQTVSSKFW